MKEEFRRAVERVEEMTGGEEADGAATPASEASDVERTATLGRFGVLGTQGAHASEGTFTDPLTENDQELSHPASENSAGMPNS
ncbi:MAG TPA: hypothetical protein VK689_19450 [Armatimonadota bacterium]|nr:hypothetical protein [Armatimonadota bacterium]